MKKRVEPIGPRCTLEDYVFKLISEKKTDSEEFKILCRIYGNHKIEAMWCKYNEWLKAAEEHKKLYNS